MKLGHRVGYRSWIVMVTLMLLSACGGGGGGSNNPSSSSNVAATTAPNRAQFTFDCDLQGVVGQLTMEVEVIQSAGAVWSSGVNPQITAVIGTGGVLYITAGDLRSPTAFYVFTGENNFADFTDMTTNQRFRVQWVLQNQDLVMIVNPFGPGPASHTCQNTDSKLL